MLLGAQEAHAILARGGLSEELAAETLAACGDNSIHVHVPGQVVEYVELRWWSTLVNAGHKKRSSCP